MKFVVEISASFKDKIIDLSPYLVSFIISSDYVNNIMPMWAFSFSMPFDVKKLLQEEDFTLPFRVYSVNSINTDADDPYASNDDIVYDEIIYEDEIIEYQKTYSNVKQITDETGGETNAIKTIPYTITGLSKSIMQINSSILNGNYRNTTSTNALYASIQDLNTKLKIVTNDDKLVTEYEQVIIPPMNLIPAIKHLIGYYPIYTTATGIFFNDKDTLHIFTDTPKSFKTRIDVEVVDNSQEIQYSPSDFVLRKAGENYYTYKTNVTPIFETTKKISDNLLGIDKVIYSYDDIFNLKDDRLRDNSNIYEKKRIYWDRSGENISAQIVNDAYHRNKTSALTFGNIDPRIFDQYTYVNIEGSDAITYIKGKYAVKSKSEVYTATSQNYTVFTNEITVTLTNVVE